MTGQKQLRSTGVNRRPIHREIRTVHNHLRIGHSIVRGSDNQQVVNLSAVDVDNRPGSGNHIAKVVVIDNMSSGIKVDCSALDPDIAEDFIVDIRCGSACVHLIRPADTSG